MTQPNFKILLVEDSPVQLLILRKLLEHEGYSVATAATAEEGLNQLEREHCGIVITDIDMPGQSGYELCFKLKSQNETRNLPVILLSSLSRTEDILRGLEAQADFYLTKPYEPKQLLRVVQQARTLCETPRQEYIPITVRYENHEFCITAGREQLVTLLLTTYESAVQQNAALTAAKAELLNAQTVLQQQQQQLQIANQQLEQLATTDGLTGISNRRAIQARLEEEFLRARNYNLPLTIALADIDFFKTFNDTFGHAAGDEVLKQVGAILRTSVRATDFVGRYGGEEFLLILPNTPASRGAEVLERIRAVVQAYPWSCRSITVSVGFGCTSGFTGTLAELLESADNALYESKDLGRNRVTEAK